MEKLENKLQNGPLNNKNKINSPPSMGSKLSSFVLLFAITFCLRFEHAQYIKESTKIRLPELNKLCVCFMFARLKRSYV